MKRPHPATIIAGTLLCTLLGLAVLTPSANATRTSSIETGDIASVDVFTLIDRALSKEDMKAAREQYETVSNQSLSGLQQQLIGLQTQLGAMQPDDPAAGQLYQQYQQIQSELQLASQQVSERYQQLIAEQIASAYTEIYAAAHEVGAEQGFSFVFATRSDGDLLQTDTITGITQEILARPLLTPPGTTDLTESVRIKLGYPEEVEADLTTEDEAGTDAQSSETTSDPMEETEESEE